MKKFWKSRTLWLNLLGAVAFFIQNQYGFVIDPVTQGYILAALNFVLRFDTKEELTIG